MLDIIVPAYNDIEGLERTLKSISFSELSNQIKITVIDDYSTDDYTSVKEKFPEVQFLRLEKNYGPGVARNIARKATNAKYIMFVDCGDIIYSKYSLLEIQDIITNNPNYYIYQWGWVDAKTNQVKMDTYHSTPGKVYAREFLEKYNLWQCDNYGSYAAEDLGMNVACVAILEKLKKENNKDYIFNSLTPIYSTIINENSLTMKNNQEFNYKQVLGYTENITHCMKMCEENNIDLNERTRIVNKFLARLFHHFLYGICVNKQFMATCWPTLHKFYLECYSKYDLLPNNMKILFAAIEPLKRNYLNMVSMPQRANIIRFIDEIKKYENIPDYYLT